MVTSAPSCSSARKWVSTRRRPITSPPGGGKLTRPKRASIGPASRIDARIRAHNLGSSSRGSARAVFTSTAFGAVHATAAPRCASSSSIVSTSRMWGTLSMRQGPSASSVAARIGRAAFLLPVGWIVPLSGRPPETQNDGGIGERKLRRALRARQAFANVRRVNPVLALGLLAVAGLLATRLPRRPSRPALHLDLAIAAGVPLVVVGLVLGPGIELIGRPLLRTLAPVTAFAIGWIGALLGARFEWRYVRRIPRAVWLLAATTATAAVVVVALGAWLLARLVPALATVWTPRLPAVLGLAAVAAVSGPRVVTAVAQAVGLRGSASRALERAAALETACGTVVMTVPLALHPSQLGAGNPELGWVSWIVFAAGCGVLVGLVFLSVTRLRPAREEARLALAASMLFGAGIGYATDLSPFVVCALAAVLIVNVAPAPRRHVVRQVLTRWTPAACAVILLVAGASLALPTGWILVAAPLGAVARIAAKWAAVRYGRSLLQLTAVPPDAGLATAAQGAAAVALGLNFAIMYDGGGVLTTVVLGVAVAQLAAPPLLRLVLGTTPAPLTQAPALPELSRGRSTELTT